MAFIREVFGTLVGARRRLHLFGHEFNGKRGKRPKPTLVFYLAQVSDLGMHALKGQKLLAQGSALGNGFPWDYALKGQKH